MKLHITKIVILTAEADLDIIGQKSVAQSFYKEFNNKDELENEMTTKIKEMREHMDQFEWGKQNEPL